MDNKTQEKAFQDHIIAALQVILNQLEQLLRTYEKTLEKTGQQIALLQERSTALISAAVTDKLDLRGRQTPTDLAQA